MKGFGSGAFDRGSSLGNASHLASYSSALAWSSHFLNEMHFGQSAGLDVSDSRSSRSVFRYPTIESLWVSTSMPSFAKAVQAATCWVWPLTDTSTRHIRHDPCGPIRSSKHRVGTSKPASRIASKTRLSFAQSTPTPFTTRFRGFTGDLSCLNVILCEQAYLLRFRDSARTSRIRCQMNQATITATVPMIGTSNGLVTSLMES